MQYCQTCGAERHPKSKPGNCAECKKTLNRDSTSQRYFQILTDLNFIVHTPIKELWDKSKKFDVTNKECGHRFSAQGSNILQGLSKCGVCGPKKRMNSALAAYKKRYGREYDIHKKEDYYKLVRALSFKNSGLKSSRQLHLEHKISIDWGFKNGAPVEMIADLDNLCLLNAAENIKKGNNINDFSLLKKLCEKYNFPLSIINAEEIDDNNNISKLIKRLPSLFTEIDLKNNILFSNQFKIKIQNAGEECVFEPNTIVLFEDEISNSSNKDRRLRIIIERLIHKSGNHKHKIFARKCEVREITSLETSRFLDCYHFQGKGKARIKLGLYFNNDLVAVMTFGKPRFAKGYDWELIRYATKSDFVVVGGAGKLLNAFRKKYVGSIITYSDRRWGEGNVYEKIGFKKIGISKPNYWWVKDNRRISRYESQLKILPELLGPGYNPALSEATNMKNCGWQKLQDLGNDIFSMA